ncbi:MAG: phosphodiester glycosidase family protein [Rhodobacteraceae bacterium]|nr:phosphodiester glycosidase family protein [Paracoccaceae bacterium]
MIRALSLSVATLVTVAGPSDSACRHVDHDGQAYAVCEVHAGEDLRMWLTAPDGQPVGSFARLRDLAASEGRKVVFAMNAGMFHPDLSPVGLFVAQGVEESTLVTAAGPGNFGMRPNGVFCVSGEGFAVMESRAFSAAGRSCDYATQSGPMLVIDGAFHPRFLADSTSRHIRNGVGVSADEQVAWFAISDAAVTFWEFASLFRDGLGVPNALYLDGSISRLYAPELGREDLGFPMGPMVALLAPEG